jgi:hypothetical protein
MNNFISQKQSAFDLFEQFKLEEFSTGKTSSPEVFHSWKKFSACFIKTKRAQNLKQKKSRKLNTVNFPFNC